MDNMKKQSVILPQTSPSYRISINEVIQHIITSIDPIKQQTHQQDNSNKNDQLKKKYRKPSFIQLEPDKQLMVDKMIREEIKRQGHMSRKMSLQDDETCLFTSDIYTKLDAHWNNRETSQITTKKLDSIPIEGITKIKILNEHPMAGYNLFRVTIDEKQPRDFAIRTIDVSSWFANSLWICLVCNGHELSIKRENEGQVQGYILKKSQFLGNWQPRYVSISPKNGLISSKQKGESPTVKMKQTSEIWSRLETITHEDTKYLILKTWYMMFKFEFAIPIFDLVKWAKAFSTLVK